MRARASCVWARMRASQVLALAVLVVLLHAPSLGHAQDAALAAALDARRLVDDAFVATEVFTWTTPAQATELSRTRHLLSRGAGDGVSRSPYQRALDALLLDPATSPDDLALARLLTSSPELGARRYAWVTPYGTAIPRGQRSYGPVLVSLSLDPQALFARFDPSVRPAFQLVDQAGRATPVASLLASPARLASVVHVRSDDAHGAYREIVVHGAVRCWAMGTPAVIARLDEDRAVVARLARVAHPRRALPLAPFWRVAAPAIDARQWTARWAATMPFDTPRHRLAPSVLTTLEHVLATRHHQRATPTQVCAP